MGKQIRDYTVGEAQDICKSQGEDCYGCVFVRGKRPCPFFDEVQTLAPADWDLSDPPRWTPCDVQDARCIQRMFPAMERVFRKQDGRLMLGCVKIVGVPDVVGGMSISADLFPALQPGESVAVADIIKESECNG